ncbi:MAG: hypothetical protein Q4A16_06385 [Lautropia sp.]|nr:hypothetical protein [Lautropia sp.]
MKTMVFSGRSMREAMGLAKQRFGAEVDILSSDSVGDEIQVTVVVPEARGRRRRTVDQVSASLKALADAPMKGERAKQAARGVEVDGPVVETGAAVMREAESAKPAETGGVKPVRTARAARVKKGGKTVAARTRASAKAARVAGKDIEQDGERGEVGPAMQATAGTTAEAEAKTEVSPGSLSTLDFEVQRRARLQQKAGPVGSTATATPGDETEERVALSAQAAALVQVLAAAREQQNAGTEPAAPEQPSGFAGVLGQQADSLLQAAADRSVGTAGAVGTVARVSGAAADTASTDGSGAGEMAGLSPDAAAALLSSSEGGRSKLSMVLSSARRMLGAGPGRWLGRPGAAARMPTDVTTSTAVSGAGNAAASITATADPAASAFANSTPAPLSSLLQTASGDWPSLSLTGRAGADEVADERLTLGGRYARGDEDAYGRWQRESRLDGGGWFEVARRRPGQMRLLRNLLSCQFSPALARTLVSLLPVDYSDVQADEWLRQTMMRALAGVNGSAGVMPGNDERTVFDRGGVFALIGPTGVGKTTSIAKIAAHHVLRHGPKSLALITADVYRIGAQEQLRAFGRMLGVPVQVAQDRDVLQQLLQEHESRSLVLIDTAGISQRDERVKQLTSALEVAQVKRVLVLNAGTQPGGIEDVLKAFGASETSGVLLSKVDEAVGLGACLDALIRHRLPLVGYTDGQRVPEDYHPAHLGKLIESALDCQATNRYPSLSMTDSEIRHLFEGSHV